MEWTVNMRVWYQPGTGTYGYETALDQYGWCRARVLGTTPTRVRILVLFPVGQKQGAVSPRQLRTVHPVTGVEA